MENTKLFIVIGFIIIYILSTCEQVRSENVYNKYMKLKAKDDLEVILLKVLKLHLMFKDELDNENNPESVKGDPDTSDENNSDEPYVESRALKKAGILDKLRNKMEADLMKYQWD